MLKRITTATTCILILAACGQPGPPPPPPFTPVGTFDITIGAEGMTLGGVMVIEGSEEAGYTGSIDTEMGGAGLGNITVDGTTVTFTIAEISAEFELVFEGDEFTGSMMSAMGGGSISGVRRESGG